MSRELGELLSHTDAAEVLGVHPRTLLRWAREGRIARVRVGRRVRFARRDVAEFLAAHYGTVDVRGTAAAVGTRNPSLACGVVVPMRRKA